MDQILVFLKDLFINWEILIAAVVSILTGLIAIALIIPGDQPEKALQGIVDVLQKISKK